MGLLEEQIKCIKIVHCFGIWEAHYVYYWQIFSGLDSTWTFWIISVQCIISVYEVIFQIKSDSQLLYNLILMYFCNLLNKPLSDVYLTFTSYYVRLKIIKWFEVMQLLRFPGNQAQSEECRHWVRMSIKIFQQSRKQAITLEML